MLAVGRGTTQITRGLLTLFAPPVACAVKAQHVVAFIAFLAFDLYAHVAHIVSTWAFEQFVDFHVPVIFRQTRVSQTQVTEVTVAVELPRVQVELPRVQYLPS